MQRKTTKTTRGSNAIEKRFLSWVKDQDCCCCGETGPSIVDHAYGSTFKHNKILLGHWFLLPLCPACDEVDTQGSRKAFRVKFGSKAGLWLRLIEKSPVQPPDEVAEAIKDWGK